MRAAGPAETPSHRRSRWSLRGPAAPARHGDSESLSGCPARQWRPVACDMGASERPGAFKLTSANRGPDEGLYIFYYSTIIRTIIVWQKNNENKHSKLGYS